MLRAVIIEDDLTAENVVMQKIALANSIVSEQVLVENTLLSYLKENPRAGRNYVEAAVNLIEKQKPDIVFLDIQLQNDDDGFAVLNSFTKRSFFTIVVTSYSHLAIASASQDIVGIFLKLSDASQLASIIEIACQMHKKKFIENTNSLLHLVKIDSKAKSLTLECIAYIQASDNYTEVVEVFPHPFKNDVIPFQYRTSLSTIRLFQFLETLPDSFVQVHKSFLVNVKKIVSINKRKDAHEKDFEIELQGGKMIPLSRKRKSEAFFAAIQKHKPELLLKKQPIWMFWQK